DVAVRERVVVDQLVVGNGHLGSPFMPGGSSTLLVRGTMTGTDEDQSVKAAPEASDDDAYAGMAPSFLFVGHGGCCRPSTWVRAQPGSCASLSPWSPKRS